MADMSHLMESETEKKYHRRVVKQRTKSHWQNDALREYFDKHFSEVFVERSAKWILRAHGLSTAHNGLTNNPAESFNAVLKRLQKWEDKTVDCVVLALNHLQQWYNFKMQEAFYLPSAKYPLKEEFKHLFDRAGGKNRGARAVLSPDDIVDEVRKRLEDSAYAKVTKAPISAPTTPAKNNKEGMTLLPNTLQSIVARATGLVEDRKTTYCREQSCWIVTDLDEKPQVVQLEPKRCSCWPSDVRGQKSLTCVHVIAARLFEGKEPLHSNEKAVKAQVWIKSKRKKSRRRSGRKGRRDDDNQQDAASGHDRSSPSSHSSRSPSDDSLNQSPAASSRTSRERSMSSVRFADHSRASTASSKSPARSTRPRGRPRRSESFSKTTKSPQRRLSPRRSSSSPSFGNLSFSPDRSTPKTPAQSPQARGRPRRSKLPSKATDFSSSPAASKSPGRSARSPGRPRLDDRSVITSNSPVYQSSPCRKSKYIISSLYGCIKESCFRGFEVAGEVSKAAWTTAPFSFAGEVSFTT